MFNVEEFDDSSHITTVDDLDDERLGRTSTLYDITEDCSKSLSVSSVNDIENDDRDNTVICSYNRDGPQSSCCTVEDKSDENRAAGDYADSDETAKFESSVSLLFSTSSGVIEV